MTYDELVKGFENGDPLVYAIAVVAVLIVIVGLFSIVVSIYLAVKYIKYNKKENSANLTGEQAARKILDMNGLEKIKVSATGSFMFGNSYSHYFKKVRLRRLTWKKQSVSSLAMAAQKSSLAILDKEKDPDVKHRVKLTPIICFGPLMFIPIVAIGVALDIFVFETTGVCTFIALGLGLLFYFYAFVLSVKVLKTEKKAQVRALEILKSNNMITSDEEKDMNKLFKLYNIEYINNIILSMLEFILNILRIILAAKGDGNISTSK